ncbi:hypothetical protein J2W51_000111 [Tardiphaga robiniae]|uniref:primase-helicase family protein n=1 Tax=Tardiphaga robiniae TaxID=943830 RepID=UPI00285703EC|nr:DUF5906 domain-containing protein [Tardiphaga robiniae]MDR6657569.1 hypothetical protein [Tardiphaga robiniae]
MTKQISSAYERITRLIEGTDSNDMPPEIAALNARNALTMWGGKAVVVHEYPTGAIQIRSLDAHRTWYANQKVQIADAAGNLKAIPLGSAWLNHPARRQYEGVEFFPNPDGALGTPNFLNLWKGFSVKASKGGSYEIFKDHILNNICNSDAELFTYVFGWFAQMMQRPREKLGTALILRGQMGTGKSKLGEVFGSLIANHFLQVDDGRYVTGNFNSHMANCLLLQADEAVWAGDKVAEGRLKGLITSEKQLIEGKGVEAILMLNYVRCLMTSNERWVVPAGLDERRFCVLDVHPRCAQNTEYFREMQTELDAGGRQRLLHDLLEFDLESVNLRRIPRTRALLDQKLRSLDSVDSYWFGRLWEGTTTTDSGEWHPQIPTSVLFQDYVKVSTQIGERRRQTSSQFGERIIRLGARKIRPASAAQDGSAQRPYFYSLPELAEARKIFEGLLSQSADWPPLDTCDDEVPFE